MLITLISDHFVFPSTEFYEEAMSLVYNLSSNSISADMWKVFELMYQTFSKDGFDFFTGIFVNIV